MKNLDNLVEDIYSKLSVLGDGKPLDVSEKDIDALGESIKEVLHHWANPSPRSSDMLRMSNIGKPTRQLWYDIKSENESTESLPAPVFIKFLYGHILEEVLLFLVKLSGHKVGNQQKEVSGIWYKRTHGLYYRWRSSRCKDCFWFCFRKFKDGTLAEQDTFGYLPQLAGYEEAEGTKKGGFLAINKETGELALFRPSEFDKPNIKKKIRDVKKAIKLDKPPQRCYNPEPEGSSGNMKLPKECVYCRHKFECHSDANDGLGLRVFKYSRGYSYLTQTPKPPKVSEVTNEWQKSKKTS